MNDKEKDRWLLFAGIATAIGGAITSYFAGKK